MMTLIALAITVAFVFSVAVTLGFPGMPLWEELATLVTIMLLGHWIEMRSISQAQGALKRAGQAAARHGERVRRRSARRGVPLGELRDRRSRARAARARAIPADGVVARARARSTSR